MRTFKVSATVMVPVHGHLIVKARSENEAVKKAMKTAKGFDGHDEWVSELWQSGDWKNISWAEAEAMRPAFAEEVPAQPIQD